MKEKLKKGNNRFKRSVAATIAFIMALQPGFAFADYSESEIVDIAVGEPIFINQDDSFYEPYYTEVYETETGEETQEVEFYETDSDESDPIDTDSDDSDPIDIDSDESDSIEIDSDESDSIEIDSDESDPIDTDSDEIDSDESDPIDIDSDEIDSDEYITENVFEVIEILDIHLFSEVVEVDSGTLASYVIDSLPSYLNVIGSLLDETFETSILVSWHVQDDFTIFEEGYYTIYSFTIGDYFNLQTTLPVVTVYAIELEPYLQSFAITYIQNLDNINQILNFDINKNFDEIYLPQYVVAIATYLDQDNYYMDSKQILLSLTWDIDLNLIDFRPGEFVLTATINIPDTIYYLGYYYDVYIQTIKPNIYLSITVLRPDFDGNLVINLPDYGFGTLEEIATNALAEIFAYTNEVHTITIVGGSEFTITEPVVTALGYFGEIMPLFSVASMGITPFAWPLLSTMDLTGYEGILGVGAFSNQNVVERVFIPTDFVLPDRVFMNATALHTISHQLVGYTPHVIDLFTVSHLGSEAFFGATDINFVRLPSNVSVLANNVFANIANLGIVMFSTDTPPISQANTFSDSGTFMLLRDDSVSANFASVPSGFGGGYFPNLSNRFVEIGQTLDISLEPVLGNPSLFDDFDIDWFLDGVHVGTGLTHTVYIADSSFLGPWQVRISYMGLLVHTTESITFNSLDESIVVTPQYSDFMVIHAGDDIGPSHAVVFTVENRGNINLTNLQVYLQRGASSSFDIVIPLNIDDILNPTVIAPGQIGTIVIAPRLHLFAGDRTYHRDYLIITNDQGLDIEIPLTVEVIDYDFNVWPLASFTWQTRNPGYRYSPTINPNYTTTHLPVVGITGALVDIPVNSVVGTRQFNITNNEPVPMLGVSNFEFAMGANSPFELVSRGGYYLVTTYDTGDFGTGTSIIPANGGVANVRVRPRMGLPIGMHEDTLYITGLHGFRVIIPLSIEIIQPIWRSVQTRQGGSQPIGWINSTSAAGNWLTLTAIQQEQFQANFGLRGEGFGHFLGGAANDDVSVIVANFPSNFTEDAAQELFTHRQLNIRLGSNANQRNDMNGLGHVTNLRYFFESTGTTIGTYFRVYRPFVYGVTSGTFHSYTGAPRFEPITLYPFNVEDGHGMWYGGNVRIAPIHGLPQGYFEDIFVWEGDNGFRIEIPVNITIGPPNYDIFLSFPINNNINSSIHRYDSPTGHIARNHVFASRQYGYSPFNLGNQNRQYLATGLPNPNATNFDQTTFFFENIANTTIRNLEYSFYSQELDPTSLQAFEVTRGFTVNIPSFEDDYFHGVTTSITHGEASAIAISRRAQRRTHISVRPVTGLPVGTHHDYLIIRGSLGFEMRIGLEFTVLPTTFDVVAEPYPLVFPDTPVGYSLFSDAASATNFVSGHRAIFLRNLGNYVVTGITSDQLFWYNVHYLGLSPIFEVTSGNAITPFIGNNQTNVSNLNALSSNIPVYNGLANSYRQLRVRPVVGLPEGLHHDILILRGDYGFELHIPVYFYVTAQDDLEVFPFEFTFLPRYENFGARNSIDTSVTGMLAHSGFAFFTLTNNGNNNITGLRWERSIHGDGGAIGGNWFSGTGIGTITTNQLLIPGTGHVETSPTSPIRMEKGDDSPFFIWSLWRGNHAIDGTVPAFRDNMTSTGTPLTPTGNTSLANIRVLPKFNLRAYPDGTPRTFYDYLIIESDQGHYIRRRLEITIYPEEFREEYLTLRIDDAQNDRWGSYSLNSFGRYYFHEFGSIHEGYSLAVDEMGRDFDFSDWASNNVREVLGINLASPNPLNGYFRSTRMRVIIANRHSAPITGITATFQSFLDDQPVNFEIIRGLTNGNGNNNTGLWTEGNRGAVGIGNINENGTIWGRAFHLANFPSTTAATQQQALNWVVAPVDNLPPGIYTDYFLIKRDGVVIKEIALHFEVFPISTPTQVYEDGVFVDFDYNTDTHVFVSQQQGTVMSTVIGHQFGPIQFNLINEHFLRINRVSWEFESVRNGTNVPDETSFVINRPLVTGSSINDAFVNIALDSNVNNQGVPTSGVGVTRITQLNTANWLQGFPAGSGGRVNLNDVTIGPHSPGIFEAHRGTTLQRPHWSTSVNVPGNISQEPVSNIRIKPRMGLSTGLHQDTLIIYNPFGELTRIPLEIYIYPHDIIVYNFGVPVYGGIVDFGSYYPGFIPTPILYTLGGHVQSIEIYNAGLHPIEALTNIRIEGQVMGYNVFTLHRPGLREGIDGYDIITAIHPGEFANVQVIAVNNLPPGRHYDYLLVYNNYSLEIRVPLVIEVSEVDIDISVELFDPHELGFDINLGDDLRIGRVVNNSHFSLIGLQWEFVNTGISDHGDYFVLQGGNLLDSPVGGYSITSLAPGQTGYVIVHPSINLGVGHHRERFRIFNDFHMSTDTVFNYNRLFQNNATLIDHDINTGITIWRDADGVYHTRTGVTWNVWQVGNAIWEESYGMWFDIYIAPQNPILRIPDAVPGVGYVWGTIPQPSSIADIAHLTSQPVLLENIGRPTIHGISSANFWWYTPDGGLNPFSLTGDFVASGENMGNLIIHGRPLALQNGAMNRNDEATLHVGINHAVVAALPLGRHTSILTVNAFTRFVDSYGVEQVESYQFSETFVIYIEDSDDYLVYDFGIQNYSEDFHSREFTVTNKGAGDVTGIRPIISNSSFVFYNGIDDARDINIGDSETWFIRPADGLAPGLHTAYLYLPNAHIDGTRLSITGENVYNSIITLVARVRTTYVIEIEPPIYAWAVLSPGYDLSDVPEKAFVVTNLSSAVINMPRASLPIGSGFTITENITVDYLLPGESATFYAQPNIGHFVGIWNTVVTVADTTETTTTTAEMFLSVSDFDVTLIGDGDFYDEHFGFTATDREERVFALVNNHPSQLSNLTVDTYHGLFDIVDVSSTTVGGAGSYNAYIAVSPSVGLPLGTHHDVLMLRAESPIGVMYKVALLTITIVEPNLNDVIVTPLYIDFGTFDITGGSYPMFPPISVYVYAGRLGLTGLTAVLELGSSSPFLRNNLSQTELTRNESAFISVTPHLNLTAGVHQDYIVITSENGLYARVRVTFTVTGINNGGGFTTLPPLPPLPPFFPPPALPPFMLP